MQATFNLCVSLTALPDISRWNTSNVTNMVKLFNMCEKLQSFPNILDILMTSEVFHMEISGKDDKEVQYEKEN